MLSEDTIKAYEDSGFKRWTKNGMDRLYINAESYGLKLRHYKSGNICHAEWQGEEVSHADGGRIESSKVWVDVKTGKLHVRTSYRPADEIREAVEAIIAEIEG